MAYTVRTDDGLTKWWFTGTGGTVNRLSELMDDQGDGPYLDPNDIGAWTQTGGTNEWYMTVATKPDGTTAAQDVKDTTDSSWMTNNDGNEGSLSAGEWAYNAGTNVLTVRLQDDSDPNSSDPEFYYDWSNFMTEHIEDELYQIHQLLEIGDGTTSTTLTSTSEIIKCDGSIYWIIKDNATFQLGELDADGNGIKGSTVTLNLGTSVALGSADSVNSVFKLYNSKLLIEQSVGASPLYYQFKGYCDIRNSLITSRNRVGSTACRLSFYRNASWSNDTPTIIKNSIITRFSTIYWYNAIEAYGNQFSNIGRITANVMNCEIWYPDISGLQRVVLATNGNPSLQVIDPTGAHLGDDVDIYSIDENDSVISEDYTVNFTIVDKDGNAISDARVKITDDDDKVVGGEEITELDESITEATTDFDVDDASGISVGDVIRVHEEYILVGGKTGNNISSLTRGYYGSPAVEHRITSRVYLVDQDGELTDGSGQTPQTLLPYKFWYSTSETEDDPNPYKITISKAGYETLVMENITIDSPIDWHFELQPIGHPPAPWEHNV